MKTHVFFLALLLFPATVHGAEPDPAQAEKLAREAVDRWEVPGAAVAIVRGDDTLLLTGFGRRALGKPAPVTPDTVFPLASCSKAFTTTLLAMLVDDGSMNWDDPVRKHLPGFTLSDPNADALLSVRDLLCHRCGIAGHDLLWYRAPWGIDEVLRRASLLPLEYPFRAGYSYSTIPFLAAGRAIERRTGEKWEKLVRTRICEALEMKGVAFTTPEIPATAERVSGHRIAKSGAVEAMPPYDMREPNPAGSVHANARDLAAWLKFHINEGLAGSGERLVSLRNLREIHTPQNIIPMEGSAKRLNPDTVQLTYAMGWLVYDHRGRKVLSHGGLIDGFKVQITFLPREKLGIAVLANLHNTRFTAALTNTLIDHYCNLPPKDWNGFFQKIVRDETDEKKRALEAQNRLRDPSVKPSLPLADFAGTYLHPAYGTATVTLDKKSLVVAWSSFRALSRRIAAIPSRSSTVTSRTNSSRSRLRRGRSHPSLSRASSSIASDELLFSTAYCR